MKKHVVIIGAGPAGLACAQRLLSQGKNSYNVTVLEKERQVGGLAKTIEYNGYRFDIGGHRFYTKNPEIQALYTNLLGKDMLVRKRMSRIYYQGKFYKYPLEIADVLKNIGLPATCKIVASYVSRQFHRFHPEKNFMEWVSNRFGDELFSLFFRSYTEKVWGISTTVLSAKWAKQRIQNFSLPVAVISSLFRANPFAAKTIISEFLYPKLGPGMFYEKIRLNILAHGGKILLNHSVIRLQKSNKRITQVEIQTSKKRMTIPCDYLVNTAPLHKFLTLCRPPSTIRREVQKLTFRSFIGVNFVIRGNPFPDNWIYIHDPSVLVARIQNYANWSPNMTKDARFSPITMEYFCNENDEFWNRKDSALINLAQSEAEKISLFDEASVLQAFVVRVPDAYPLYNIDYDTPLQTARIYLESYSNLFTCGRGGLFRYNNMDHSMLTGIQVAENILQNSPVYTIWNTDDGSYLEEKS